MMRRNNQPTSLMGRASPRPELLANPSVEQDADNSGVPDRWNVSASGALWSSAQARTGVRSLRLNVAEATAQWIAYAFPVTGNDSYDLSAYIKGTGSGQTFLTIRWWSDVGATAFISEDNIMLNGTYADWTRIVQTFIAPANAVSADVVFRCPSPTTADIYGDDFSVRRVN